MQLDWVSGIIAAPPALSPGYSTGFHLTVAPDGSVSRQRPAPLDLVEEDPTHSRRFRVLCTSPGSLYLSGNPVKLLQGHNLFGSCDAIGLFLAAGTWVRQQAGLFPGPDTWRSCQFEGPRFTRLDLTRSYRFPRAQDASAWIREVAGAARSRHGAAKLYGSSTAVWGEGSRRWSMKVYDKELELLERAKRAIPTPRELLEWSSGVVRFELTLRGPELQQEAESVALLRGPNARASALELWSKYYERITFNENASMNNPSLLETNLPPHLALKLAAWRGGADLRGMLSKSGFYKVRRQLLDAVAVDIAAPPPPAASVARLSGAALDPAGWDPEPLAAHYVEPGDERSAQYGLL
jgi:hypothetical protein